MRGRKRARKPGERGKPSPSRGRRKSRRAPPRARTAVEPELFDAQEEQSGEAPFDPSGEEEQHREEAATLEPGSREAEEALDLPIKRMKKKSSGAGRFKTPGNAAIGGSNVVLLITILLALGTVVMSAFFTRLQDVHWGFWFYLVVFTACAQFNIKVRGGAEVNLGLAPLLAALISAGLVYGKAAEQAPFPVVWVLWLFLFGTAAGLLVRLLGGRVHRDDLFRMLLDYVGVGLVALVFHLLVDLLPKRPEFFGNYWAWLLVGTVVSAALYFFVQLLGMTFVLSQEGYFPASAYFSSILRELWAPYATVSLIGVLMGLVYMGIGMWSSLFVVPPLFAVMYAYGRVTDTDRYLLETVRTLSSIPEETGMIREGHAESVARMCVAVARELGLSPEDVSQVEYAAYLHDIGVVAGVAEPEDGQGRLIEEKAVTPGGAEVVDRVACLEVAAEILKGREGLRDRVEDAGRRKAVSVGAGILSAVDDFQGLVEGSGGREALAPGEALSEMNLERGVRYDSKVLRAMARVLARMPREGKTEVAEGRAEGSPFWGEQEDKGT